VETLLGPVMLDIEGLELTNEDREVLAHPLVGGVILFARNYHSTEQIAALSADIRRCSPEPRLIAVDQEGGRVQRFRAGFTPLPAMQRLGRLYDEDPRSALRLAELTGWVMATELRRVDVDLSFAPVVDLDHGASEVIGDRAFHDDPEVVFRLARALISGMNAGGMSAVAKHFPGHGAVEADSHVAIAEDARTLDDLRRWDLVPYQRLVRMELPAVMMAHVSYPRVDELPASLSRTWIREILRRDMDFGGAVFSDDLCMAGAGMFESVEERALVALEAGCDMLPVCNDRQAAAAVLDALPVEASAPGSARLVRLRGRSPEPERGSVISGWDEARAEVLALCDPA
jgi:beta-N-acetylhexosaminidase